MKVQDIMTREVVAAKTDTSVNEVAKRMHRHGVSGLPVQDGTGRVVGVITELDMILHHARLEGPVFLRIFDANIPLETPKHLRERLRHVLGTRAEDVMTRDAHTIEPEADVEDLIDLMVKKWVNPVPVVQQGQLVGIVSRSDIIRRMAADLGED